MLQHVGAPLGLVVSANGYLVTISGAYDADRTLTVPNRDLTIRGVSGTQTANRLSHFDANGDLTDSAISEGVSGGVLAIGGSFTGNHTATFPDADISISGSASALTANRLPKATGTGGILQDSTIAEGSITGLLTLSKTGTTARTVTFPDRALTVAGTGTGTTSGTLAKFDANANLADSLIIDNVGTGALTIVKTGTTARTITFPDAAITVAGSASALTSGRVPYATTGGLLTDSATGLLFNGTELGIGAAATASNGLLQLASGTTKANGIAFGTDVFLYRGAAGKIVHYGTNPWYSLQDGTTEALNQIYSGAYYIGTQTNHPLYIRTNQATAITVNTSQDVALSSTTDATSTTAAALTVAGGLGVAKKTFLGDDLDLADGKYIYLRGNGTTDGSIRFSSQASNTMTIESRVSGSWNTIATFT